MFCQRCGTQLHLTATECSNCNARTTPAKFCQKCGQSMPGDAKFCGACNTKSAVASTPLQWLSLGFSLIAFITFGILGGDYALNEVNIFDWLTIPISLAAIIIALVCIPRERTALKVVSIIIAVLFFIGSIGWVFL